MIAVEATSFLGARSNLVTHIVTSKHTPPPLLSIDMPPAPVYASTELYFVARAAFSSCVEGKRPLEYVWMVGLTSPVTAANMEYGGLGRYVHMRSRYTWQPVCF